MYDNQLDQSMESSFKISARLVDEEVAKGRHLDDVLAEQGDSIWFNRQALRPYSKAVEAACLKEDATRAREEAAEALVLDPMTKASFQISGHYVDMEVLKGRHLDDVLSQHGDSIWHNRQALRPYSAAVAASFQK